RPVPPGFPSRVAPVLPSKKPSVRLADCSAVSSFTVCPRRSPSRQVNGAPDPGSPQAGDSQGLCAERQQAVTKLLTTGGASSNSAAITTSEIVHRKAAGTLSSGAQGLPARLQGEPFALGFGELRTGRFERLRQPLELGAV